MCILLTASSAGAQTADKPDGSASGGTLEGDPIRKGLTAPGNGGVAGTGLGGTKEKPIGGASGTGQSVQGPPGTGIDGGDKTKIPRTP